MQPNREPRPSGISRRHVVSGALGAIASPLAGSALAKAIEQPATEADIGFMRMALEEAAQGDAPYFFGAVIVRDGEVLARGHNVWNRQQDPTAHAEITVIRRFLAAHGMEKIKGTTLYSTGESCPMCMGAITWCGIGRLVYGASIAQLAIISVVHQSTRRPSPASLAPGASNSFHGILAWRRCASSMPATTPGTAIEPGPCRLRSSFTRGQGKMSEAAPPVSG